MHPIKLTFKVASSGFIGPSPSTPDDSKLPFSVIPAFANTVSIRPCSLYTFSKIAAWLSQEDTSHCSNVTLAYGNSSRSWLNVCAPVVALISRIVTWMLSWLRKCFVIPRPMPDAPPEYISPNCKFDSIF